ncbi:MAG: ankyrin repeat domain-containing protein [Rivularia sp. (in: cyanobacteria)]
MKTLGEGGSGITYLALDLQNHQTVALKALSLHRINHWKAMELFEREAKILSQLNHPAIPRYLQYFDTNTKNEHNFYIAQQLAPGNSLAFLVKNNWRTNEKQVRNIATQILEILIYLHSLKPPVIHRDIKPQNIIHNRDGKIFLVDFGAVKDTYYSTAISGSTVVGTYGYMAPEQFQGKAVPATDLYGLAATLLFLLTHREAADFPTDGLKIDFRSWVRVSEDFADWLEIMLSPDLDERFSSAKIALEVLSGKRKIITAPKKPMLFKAVIGFAFATVFTVSIFHHYKWTILDKLGFTPEISICSNVDEIRDYINQGGNPNLDFARNSQDKNFKSLLVCAIEQNSQSTAEFLISKGANPDSALHGINSVDWAQFLIAKGADVNRINFENQTPLHYATINYQKEIVGVLLSHQANVNAKDKFGNTPLHLISQINQKNSDYLGIKYLINNRIKFKYKNEKRRLNIVKLLVDKGANIDIKNNRGYTPLHLGAKEHHKYIVEYLIQKGAKIDERATSNAKTPLMLAAKGFSNISIIQLLIENGANVNAKDKDGETPLHIAGMNTNKNNDIIQLLVKSGADINAKNNNGETPLHKSLRRHSNQTQLLVKLGADINARDNIGETPLHTAIYWYKGNQDIKNSVRYLVESGAKINLKDNNSLTPLHIAAASSVTDLVKLLIELGADVNAQDSHGNTVLNIATKNRDRELMETILLNNATK